jgi:hypothetical protein
MTEYNAKTKVELVALCKEKGLKGHSQIGITKEKIIQLLTGKIEYKDPREKENWSEKKKDSFEKTLKERQLKNNLFDYLTKKNPSILTKYFGNLDELKQVSFGTMVNTFKWKCKNYIECSNVFEARPRDIFRNDKRQIIYCSLCKNKERGKTYQKNMLEKNGSIKEKIPDIVNIWCEDNKFKSEELTDNSHEKIKLKCPNKSAKHPDYEISVYNIKESNCISCPKCSVKTSKAEIRIYSELKYAFKDVMWQQKIDGREADITIEDLKLVIEVDGFPWHMDKAEKDLVKNSIFEKNGYNVLRIRDPKLEKISCNSLICNLSDLSLTDYNKIVEWINIHFNCNMNIFTEWKNIEYYREIQASLLSVPYDESVEYLFPVSKDLWDYKKNHPLIPSHFRIGSNMKVWIKCKSGHSYERQINHMFRIRNDAKYENEKQVMNCPDCPKPKYKSNNPNQRIIEVNGKSYKNITECCKDLNITRTYLYEKMKANGIDKNLIDNIQKLIEELLKAKVPV